MPAPLRPPNPFGSRFTRPGALPFLLPDGEPLREGAGEIASRILQCWRTAVVGPHGTGKTTLLSEIERALKPQFGDVLRGGDSLRRVTLRIGEPASELWKELSQTRRGSLLVIDGYEQLPWWGRAWLMVVARCRRVRLLVTAHPTRLRPYPCGFTVIARTAPSEIVARTLLEELLAHRPGDGDAMRAAFAVHWRNHPEDVRRLWSTLYDEYESRLRQHPSALEESS